MAKSSSKFSMADMTISSLAAAQQAATTSASTSDAAVLPSPATVKGNQDPILSQDPKQTTRTVWDALKQLDINTQGVSNNSAEMSLSVLSVLDCIVVDGYDETFSLSSLQQVDPTLNPNIIDDKIMERKNEPKLPDKQFPDIDSVFYELDEGDSVALQKEKQTLAASKGKDLSNIVAALMEVNYQEKTPTVKQLAATQLKTMSEIPKSAPSREKKIFASAAENASKNKTTKDTKKRRGGKAKAIKKTASGIKKY